jgi:hypothetical protein
VEELIEKIFEDPLNYEEFIWGQGISIIMFKED